jgi:hypothetical protein
VHKEGSWTIAKQKMNMAIQVSFQAKMQNPQMCHQNKNKEITRKTIGLLYYTSVLLTGGKKTLGTSSISITCR